MRKTERIFSCVLIFAMLFLTACGGNGTFTITLTNGVILEAQADKASDYELYLSQENTLVVKEGGNAILEGHIINAGYFDSMLAQIPDMEGATILNQSDTSCTYRYEEDGNVTIGILRKVTDSEISILWGSEQSAEKAEDAVDHIFISEVAE